MSTLQCLACNHENPRGAKFCQECGSRLNLKLCTKCEAINEIKAQACHQCGTAFALPLTVASAASRTPWRPRIRTAAIAAGVLMVLAVSGFAYQFVDRQPVASAPTIASEPGPRPIAQPAAAPREDKAAPPVAPRVPSAPTRAAVTHTRPAPP